METDFQVTRIKQSMLEFLTHSTLLQEMVVHPSPTSLGPNSYPVELTLSSNVSKFLSLTLNLLTSVFLHKFAFYHHLCSLSVWLLTCLDRIYLHGRVENSLLSTSKKRCPVYYTSLIGSTFSLTSLHFISKNTHLSSVLIEQQLLTHSKVSLYGTSTIFTHIYNCYHLSMSKPRFKTNLMLFYKMGENWT